MGGPLMTFSPDCWEKISQRGAGSFAPSTGPGTPFFPEREASLTMTTNKRAMNDNSNPDGKCKWFGCNNDAIGVVGRDPYDHVSWSPVVTPAPYCLNCYNERILDALEFVMREVK